MKSIAAINPVVTENMECLIVKASAPVINQNAVQWTTVLYDDETADDCTRTQLDTNFVLIAK